jgi:hypothetical protein
MMLMFTRFTLSVFSAGLLILNIGCTNSAQLDLSAGRALETIATEMRNTVEEYHADLARWDEQREAFVIQAFVARVAGADGDKTQLQNDSAALSAALANLRADRAVAVKRYIIALANLDVLTQTADGLMSHARARLRIVPGVLKVLANEE